MGILFNEHQVDIPSRDENILKHYAEFKTSLISYKKKLDSQISEEENKFNEIKRKREEDNENFLEKVKEFHIDDSNFKQMLDKAMEDIKKEVEKHNKLHPPPPMPEKETPKPEPPKSVEDKKVYNENNLDLHDDDSGSTVIDDEEMDDSN